MLNMSILFTFLYFTMYIGAFGQDFHVRFTESAMNKLVQYVIPNIKEHVGSQRIPAQEESGFVDVKVGAIIVREFTFNLTLLLEEETQSINTQITDLTLRFWPFRFSVQKQATDTLGITCHTAITPAFADWNLSFKFDVSVDDQCSLVLTVKEESILIKPGTIDINVRYLTDFCRNLFGTAAWVLDLENNIENEILDKMPDIITNDLQSAVNDGLKEMRYIEGINVGLCYTQITVTELRISVGGDFITDFDGIEWNPTEGSTQSLYFEEAIPQFANAKPISPQEESQSLIAILFVVFVLVALGIGICISYAICYCIYKPKFKGMEEKTTGDDGINEQEPMITDTSVVA